MVTATRQATNQQATPIAITAVTSKQASNFAPSDCTTGHQGGDDVRAVKGSLLIAPNDRVRLTVSADYTHDQSENPADQLLSVTGPGSTNLQAEAGYFGIAYDSRFVTGNPFTTYATYTDPVGSGVVIPGSTFHNGLVNRGGAKFSPINDLQNRGVSGPSRHSATVA
ncbi:hypothetical protein [Caulobacter sp. RL271]|uniref:TonB-dependent receptor n=1 Tax=Caulobacter segnis TaxID=88688 RepID=A0ABY5A1E3_9CAUL|nr:hypothetical protein [Caulobacter segnis]USQ98052.1 hypothetical protein MZV50_11145 [Caulobacter segnis]